MPKTDYKRQNKQLAPDGGYGWAIVGAFALFYGIFYSMSQVFGLMYKHKIDELHLQVKDISFMLSSGFACGSTTGLIAAPFIKKFGCRKIAFVAALFYLIGLILTAYARNFLEFFISYSIIEAMGYGLGASAYLLALTSYFDKKRAKAVSLALTLTALVSSVYPPLVTIFLQNYGGHMTILLLAAIGLHLVFSALLLQPIKWHLRNVRPEIEIETIPFQVNTVKLNSVDNAKFADENFSDENPSPNNGYRLATQNNTKCVIVSRIIDTFDLTLLLDKSFVIVVVGISLVDCAEFCFTPLTALILEDKSYSNTVIASILSVLGIADLILRFSSAYIEEFLGQKPRHMFMYSVVLFIISRIVIFKATTYTGVLIGAIINGIGKGIMIVYWNVVIPSCVPIERLAAATGIIMITDGILLLTIGPVIGYLRDVSGNYGLSIWVLNVFSCLSIIIWSIEMFYKRKSVNRNDL